MSSQKANLTNSLGLFVVALVTFFTLRWAVLEPFVIPSGSMIPTLLIHDHIGVAKWTYGWRWPFTQKWMVGPKTPSRFDIVVFKSIENPDMYMIKRVIGLPGEKVEFLKDGGLRIDGQPLPREPAQISDFLEVDLEVDPSEVDFIFEGQNRHHLIMQRKAAFRWQDQVFTVPTGHLLMVGDNRDASHDGRFWGYLPLENLVGQARFVWLSCTETLTSSQNICSPHFIRWQKLFSPIQ